MIEVDGAEQIAAGLRTASLTAGFRAARVVEGSAQEVRDEARRLAPRTRLPRYAESITYDIEFTPGTVVGEIGPERGGQGSLGHILERGTVRTPPHAHLGPALDRVAPGFVRELAEQLGELRLD